MADAKPTSESSIDSSREPRGKPRREPRGEPRRAPRGHDAIILVKHIVVPKTQLKADRPAWGRLGACRRVRNVLRHRWQDDSADSGG